MAFDRMGLRWEYEREGFRQFGISYLPDFFLPDLGVWFEVKGEWPLDTDKQAMLTFVTNKTVYLAFGGIPNPIPDAESLLVFYPGGGRDLRHWFTYCETCAKISIGHNGELPKPCRVNGHIGGYVHPKLFNAYAAARNERFGT